jgi:hypothetical protein
VKYLLDHPPPSNRNAVQIVNPQAATLPLIDHGHVLIMREVT